MTHGVKSSKEADDKDIPARLNPLILNLPECGSEFADEANVFMKQPFSGQSASVFHLPLLRSALRLSGEILLPSIPYLPDHL
jgi:hypothetical protein